MYHQHFFIQIKYCLKSLNNRKIYNLNEILRTRVKLEFSSYHWISYLPFEWSNFGFRRFSKSTTIMPNSLIAKS